MNRREVMFVGFGHAAHRHADEERVFVREGVTGGSR
jgi:hypothetical protein